MDVPVPRRGIGAWPAAAGGVFLTSCQCPELRGAPSGAIPPHPVPSPAGRAPAARNAGLSRTWGVPSSDDRQCGAPAGGAGPPPAVVASAGESALRPPTYAHHMAAGAIAGTTEHLAMFPVDTIKTRMQAPLAGGLASRAHASVAEAFSAVLRTEGVAGLYRGFGAMGLAAGPAHAVYFAAYEAVKEVLGGNRPGHHLAATAAAGACATVAHDAIFTPLDVVKQRLQLVASPYRSTGHCIRRILAEEGLRGFYRSYPVTLVMNVPFTAIYFSTYESAKTLLAAGAGESESLLSGPLRHMAAGAVSGALAAGATTPLDVIKTRLQTQGICRACPAACACGSARGYSREMLATLRQIVAEEGPWALARGWKPRVMFHIPAAAICWTTYEAIKAFLRVDLGDPD